MTKFRKGAPRSKFATAKLRLLRSNRWYLIQAMRPSGGKPTGFSVPHELAKGPRSCA